MEENEEIKEENNNQVNTTNENNLNNKELMPNKKNALVIFLIIAVVLLSLGLVYVLFFMKGDKKENNTPTPTSTPEATVEPQETENPKDNENGELIVYKYKDDGRITSRNEADEDLIEAFRLKVSSKDAEVLAVDQNGKYLIYNDKVIKIYDIKNKTVKDTKLSGNYEDYTFFINEDGNNVNGIAFRDSNDYIGYYNVSLEKSLYYDKKYKKDDSPFISRLNDNYLSLETDDYAYLLSSNEEKVVLSHKYKENEGDWYGYGVITIGNKYIYDFSACVDDCVTYKLYDENFKEFYNGEVSEYNMSYSKNYIYIFENNIIKKYDNSGNVVATIDKYKDIKRFGENYVVYISDGNLVVENMDDQSENKVIAKWNDNWWIDFVSYYTREQLDEYDEKDKKEGLYIAIYYSENGDVKDSKGNYGMEYCYTPDKQLIEYPIDHEMGGRAKPVLYLYPEKETDVTVTFAHPEYLTTTYPKYINSWNVKVSPNGDMRDKDGKYYYALYWDEKRYNEASFSEGFYVEGKNAIKFLEEKLAYIVLVTNNGS